MVNLESLVAVGRSMGYMGVYVDVLQWNVEVPQKWDGGISASLTHHFHLVLPDDFVCAVKFAPRLRQ